GETKTQWMTRALDWARCFALLPRKWNADHGYG
ncbi:MAG: hypothetical protein ACI92Z_003023, partial [Paracoccaceae bacterium]